MAKLTPMMEQYMKLKEEYPYCLLFFRLGDFYEMFFDDAIIASRELDLTLTGRDCGQDERAPMCGVPYHSVDAYVSRLIAKGHKVAICEQMENPKATKEIVRRDVVRIVTPGTIQDESVLDKGKNNYIVAIYEKGDRLGVSAADVTTGEFYVFSIYRDVQKLIDELSRFSPAEIIATESFSGAAALQEHFKLKLTLRESFSFDDATARDALLSHFRVITLEGFGIEKDAAAVCAAGGLMRYLRETQKNALSHITSLKLYHRESHMAIDAASRRNLELCETLRERKKHGSLLWVMDRTKTAMGARMLRKWLMEPLTEADKINARLDAVEELKQQAFVREGLREVLQGVNDIERIMGRVVYGTANGRDLLALKNSFGALPAVKDLLKPCAAAMNKYFASEMDALADIYSLIERSICDEPPVVIRDGGVIRDGYSAELDGYREAKQKGAGWMLELEAKERELTGIKGLKIKYSKVFGYCMEVTKSYQKLVPERYIRTQTLANCERYATPELKEIEEAILGADEKIIALENGLFNDIRVRIAGEVRRVRQSANILAAVDAVQSLAEVAEKHQYTRPRINGRGDIEIKDGRHPVVERTLGEGGAFIPNDTFMNITTDRLLTLTGPNMAGKSTYMRQVALIVLMAQVGSFVPASYANIAAVDKIFTRVGASDDLATGQSTFMMEMTEVSNILNNATPKSLIILDEIGRGTSTYDGLSIAWAVLEYIADKKGIGAKTLFATHYHEMTELEGKIPGVVNYCVRVKESGDDIVFLRKIARGGADRSYGVHVAKLAGLPESVITRAMEIMSALSVKDNSPSQNASESGSGGNGVVYYGTNRRRGPQGNRLTIEQTDDGESAQITIRDVLKNI